MLYWIFCKHKKNPKKKNQADLGLIRSVCKSAFIVWFPFHRPSPGGFLLPFFGRARDDDDGCTFFFFAPQIFVGGFALRK